MWLSFTPQKGGLNWLTTGYDAGDIDLWLAETMVVDWFGRLGWGFE